MTRAARSDRDTDRPHGATPHPRWVRRSTSQLCHILGSRAFLPLHDVELHPLAFDKRLETSAFNRRMMDEAVLLSVLTGDEAKSLTVVEPLDGPCDTHRSNS